MYAEKYCSTIPAKYRERFAVMPEGRAIAEVPSASVLSIC